MADEKTGPQRQNEWGDLQREAEQQRGTYTPDQPPPPDRTEQGPLPDSASEGQQSAPGKENAAGDEQSSGAEPTVANSVDEAYDTTAR